jgi:hypothetical protein
MAPHRPRSRTSVLTTATLLGFAFSGCECDPEIQQIAPQIFLDVCDTPQRKVNGEFIGGYEDCQVAFGDRDISVKVEKQIKITNPSQVELKIFNVETTGDPNFKVELAPERIGPGLSGFIVISVRPRAEVAISGRLYVYSDANNTPQVNDRSEVIVDLTATGVDNGVPNIDIDPTECEFGNVAANGVEVCPVTITNTGNRGLVLDVVAFEPIVEGEDALFQVPSESVRGGADGACDPTSESGCAFAFTGRPPGPDEEIAPGQSVVLAVRFTPDALGNYAGLFRVLSNDPDEGDGSSNGTDNILIALGGIGVTPPECAIKIKSVNGVEVGDSVPEIEPLDNVILSLEDSTPSSADGSISGYAWSIPANGRPVGSTVQLTTDSAETTGFTFDDDLGIDLAGTYTVRAQVFDNLGTASVNECEIQFEAIPKDHFLVQLTWDTPENDLDLHVTRADDAGVFCITNTSGDTPAGLLTSACSNGRDCNFATCQGGGPEWDGVTGETAGDPSLDIDDINGFGPENTNVDLMGPGEYLIGVNEYSGTSEYEAGATVRIFIYGRIAAELFKQMDVGDWWEAAMVRWPTAEEAAEGIQPCVEDLTDNNATDDCG